MSESDSSFYRWLHWGALAGIYQKYRSVTPRKQKKMVMPKEGTPEFDVQVKKGEEIFYSVVIGTILWILWHLYEWIKNMIPK